MSRRRRTSLPQPSRSALHDLPRHDLRVLAHAGEDRRLELSHPVHADKVEPWHRSRAVGLDGEAHVIEHRKLYPAVLRSIAAGPDDASDSLASEVKLSSGDDPHRRRQIVDRPRHSGPHTTRVDVAPYLRPARIAEVDAGGQVVSEVKRRALRAREAPKQLDAHLVQRAVVEIMPAPVTRGLRITDQPGRGRRELVWGSLRETGLPEPPDQAVATDAARSPWAAPARNEGLPTCLMQLLRQLAAGLAAADDENVARWQLGGAAVLLGEDLVDRRRQVLAAPPPVPLSVPALGHPPLPPPQLQVPSPPR